MFSSTFGILGGVEISNISPWKVNSWNRKQPSPMKRKGEMIWTIQTSVIIYIYIFHVYPLVNQTGRKDPIIDSKVVPTFGGIWWIRSQGRVCNLQGEIITHRQSATMTRPPLRGRVTMCSNSSQLIQWPTTSVDVVVTSHFTWKEPGACLFVCLVGWLFGWLFVWFVCLFVCLVGCLVCLNYGDGRLPGLLYFHFLGGQRRFCRVE